MLFTSLKISKTRLHMLRFYNIMLIGSEFSTAKRSYQQCKAAKRCYQQSNLLIAPYCVCLLTLKIHMKYDSLDSLDNNSLIKQHSNVIRIQKYSNRAA